MLDTTTKRETANGEATTRRFRTVLTILRVLSAETPAGSIGDGSTHMTLTGSAQQKRHGINEAD